MALAEPVEDNSFLVEEAYNQEPGVVQFINVYQKSSKTKDWSYTFINEIPVVSQTHQFSYEIPYKFLEASDKTGIGDFKLNYRNEFFRTDSVVTTGRLSLTTASGAYKDGFGVGTSSYEVSLVASVKVSEQWSQHWNVGASITPKAKNSADVSADNSRYFWNMSNVYYITEKFNFMLELTTALEETTTAADKTDWGSSFVASPSFRYAIDVGDWQFVPGIAAPANLGQNAGQNNQTLVYLSIEGKLW